MQNFIRFLIVSNTIYIREKDIIDFSHFFQSTRYFQKSSKLNRSDKDHIKNYSIDFLTNRRKTITEILKERYLSGEIIDEIRLK